MSPTPTVSIDAARRSVAHTRTRDAAGAKQDAFFVALLSGAPVGQACQQAGISRATGLRWRRAPEFQERLTGARRELLSSAVGALHSHALDFVSALHKIATDDKARGSDRVGAAREGLSALYRGVEIDDFARRLTAVEGEQK
jgi:hypothetical protein